MTRTIPTTASQYDTPPAGTGPADLKSRIANLEDILRGYTAGELVPGVRVVLKLDVADGATADVDFADLPVAFEIDDVQVVKQDAAATAVANTIQVQTSGAVAVTDAISINNFAVGQIARAANVAPATRSFAKGSTLRVRRVKAGGNAAARVNVVATLVAG